jgi:hypothetical protein
MHLDTFKITPPAVSLSNNATNLVFDTTYSANTASWTTTASTLRNMFLRHRIAGFVDATTQNVTVRLDYLKADSTWITSVTTQTVTAGTTQPIDWLPGSADWRVVIVNGATGPSALVLSGWHLSNNPVSGT